MLKLAAAPTPSANPTLSVNSSKFILRKFYLQRHSLQYPWPHQPVLFFALEGVGLEVVLPAKT